MFLTLTFVFSFFTFSHSHAQKANDNYIIDIYTTWPATTISNKDTLSVNDTLVVEGDLTLSQGAVLNINENAVCIIHGNLDIGTDGLLNIYENALCIIYGDLYLNNKVSLSIGAHLIVGGDLTSTANSDKIVATIDSTAAVYVLGEVDTAQIEGFNCPNTEDYIPYTGEEECTYGDIISLEDNENDSTGIYDLFVLGDAEKGVYPVYSELCAGGAAVLSAVYDTAFAYQWCDSSGVEIDGATGVNYTTTEAGEYFVKIYLASLDEDPTISHRAKVVGTSLNVDIVENETSVCYDATAEFTLVGTDGATVFYHINGGSSQSVVLGGGTTTVSVSNVETDQTLTIISAETDSVACEINLTSSITVNAIPTATISADNGPVCEGDEVIFSLTGTAGATLTYTINGGANETLELDGGSGVINVEDPIEDQLVTLVSVINGSCTQILNETRTVVVNPVPITGDIEPD
ncbi:hypothetical protein SLH46_02090 [Draconibacterium sp. IB214405]|uniref:hypothetical protein n=1 Tax=Draconibacterium sp. IB214405 TaxID=3097352 RepID=UPI002A108874|nr:hypothetical protein [Draconibacterium sp. IB214405]MDX8337954.1 hypothetical protein [Draconibacterium sp. IB214405]